MLDSLPTQFGRIGHALRRHFNDTASQSEAELRARLVWEFRDTRCGCHYQPRRIERLHKCIWDRFAGIIHVGRCHPYRRFRHSYARRARGQRRYAHVLVHGIAPGRIGHSERCSPKDRQIRLRWMRLDQPAEGRRLSFNEVSSIARCSFFHRCILPNKRQRVPA